MIINFLSLKQFCIKQGLQNSLNILLKLKKIITKKRIDDIEEY